MMLDPTDPVSGALRAQVDARIHSHLEQVSARLTKASHNPVPLVAVATDLIAGGKRLRPAFGYWGYVAVLGQDDIPEGLWRLVSALELLHVGVLIHDDVLDRADTRRGRPAAHRQFEIWYRRAGGAGDAAEFGRALAVLLGDQLLVWSGELAEHCGLAGGGWQRANPFWHALRSEVNNGQMLDICAQFGMGGPDDAFAERLAREVLEEKTARYTVQRPVQLGAAAAGATAATLAALGEYGLALGRAFQLRDDLLGVFADEDQTGKPAAGDLMNGKRTILLARALAAAPPGDTAWLVSMLGRPDLNACQIDRARQIITDSGAVQMLEEAIGNDHRAALAALQAADLTEPGRTALIGLAQQCAYRAN